MNADHHHPVHRQRAALCDLLDGLTDAQWSAETLCAGWTAGHIAAHLLVREREPIPALGILFGPLSSLHDRRIEARLSGTDRHQLVEQLRSGPTPWFRLPLARDVQVGEDWIHTEDVARGGAATADGTPPPVRDGSEDPDIATRLWQAVGRFAPLLLRGTIGEGIVALTDDDRTRTYRVGGGRVRPAKGATADLTLRGPVGELLLFTVGRDAAHFGTEGDDGLLSALRATDRSF